MKSKLDETHNFIDLAVYAAGDWKTPTMFHRWAAISLIAASVEDRVWLSIFDHAPLKPNLWTFLIGPSGSGKDHAVGHALSLLKPEDNIVKIDGKVTMPALYDFLHDMQKARQTLSAPIYLISSDVTEQLPVGPEAKDFTSRVLALYGGRDRDLLDLTRTSGSKIVRNPLLNWLAGCTPEWFPQAIDPAVFASGFTGRAFFVFGEPDYRYFHMMKPIERHDKQAVMEFLRQRVERFQAIEGMFTVSSNAKTIYDQWLRHVGEQAQRQHLTDVERQIYGRIKTSAEKLAMIFSLANWRDGELLIIKAKHMRDAILEVEWLLKNAQRIADFAFSTTDTAVLDKVRDLIRSEGTVRRSRLLQAVTQRGVRGSKHLDEIIETLKQMGQIQVDQKRSQHKGGPWTTLYTWRPRTMKLGGLNEEEQSQGSGAVAVEDAPDTTDETPVVQTDQGSAERSNGVDHGSVESPEGSGTTSWTEDTGTSSNEE